LDQSKLLRTEFPYFTGQSKPTSNSSQCCYALEIWTWGRECCKEDWSCSYWNP